MRRIHLLLLVVISLSIFACSAPRSVFSVKQKEVVAPADIEFINSSENAEAFEWDFGDGTVSTDTAASHRYRRSGQYTVTLKATKGEKSNISKQELMVKAPESCLVEIETPQGNMLVQLYDETPLHRDNFLKLAEDGFYNELIFHRVIDGFMIQGGDPNSRDAPPGANLGSGGPGYQIAAEFNESHIHLKGALAAARTGDGVNPERKSSGSQFYIVQGNPVNENMLEMVGVRNGIEYSPDQRKAYAEVGGTPQLDMQYTVFGRVIEGLEVIDKIAGVRTDGRDRPQEDVKMKIYLVK